MMLEGMSISKIQYYLQETSLDSLSRYLKINKKQFAASMKKISRKEQSSKKIKLEKIEAASKLAEDLNKNEPTDREENSSIKEALEAERVAQPETNYAKTAEEKPSKPSAPGGSPYPSLDFNAPPK